VPKLFVRRNAMNRTGLWFRIVIRERRITRSNGTLTENLSFFCGKIDINQEMDWSNLGYLTSGVTKERGILQRQNMDPPFALMINYVAIWKFVQNMETHSLAVALTETPN
jgi:hypothetical protein